MDSVIKITAGVVLGMAIFTIAPKAYDKVVYEIDKANNQPQITCSSLRESKGLCGGWFN